MKKGSLSGKCSGGRNMVLLSYFPSWNTRVADVRALTGLKGLRAGQLVAFYLISICPAQHGG